MIFSKKFITIYLLCFVTNALTGQTDYSSRELRSKGLFFKVGGEYRITPIYNSPGFGSRSNPGYYTNASSIHTGFALSYGLEYFLSKNFGLEFENTIRHKAWFYPSNAIANDFGALRVESSFLFGWHIYLDYLIQLTPKSEIFLRAGYSTYNIGSSFLYKVTVYDNSGGISYQADFEDSFKNSGGNFAIGIKKERLQYMLGIYLSKGDVYYPGPNFNIYTPYIKLSYFIGKL